MSKWATRAVLGLAGFVVMGGVVQVKVEREAAALR